MTTMTVPSRFNGPPASGQGGYATGVIASHLEGPAAVSLRRPIPLEEALEVRVETGDAEGAGDGPTQGAESTVARAFDAAGELIIEAVPAPPVAAWDAPPVSLEAAHRAKSAFVPPADGTFDHCFVCGRARHDGFNVRIGAVEGTDLVAAPWTPPAWAADESGEVLPEFVYAALDCPGYFALHVGDGAVAFLARQQSEVHAPVRVGVDYITVGRPVERDGRKGFAATAIIDSAGEVVAQSEQLVIVPREAMSQK